jgi:hypothetical protein
MGRASDRWHEARLGIRFGVVDGMFTGRADSRRADRSVDHQAERRGVCSVPSPGLPVHNHTAEISRASGLFAARSPTKAIAGPGADAGRKGVGKGDGRMLTAGRAQELACH